MKLIFPIQFFLLLHKYKVQTSRKVVKFLIRAISLVEKVRMKRRVIVRCDLQWSLKEIES